MVFLGLALSGCRDDGTPNAEDASSGTTVVDPAGTTEPDGTSSTTEALEPPDASGTSQASSDGSDASGASSSTAETSGGSDESGTDGVAQLVIEAQGVDAWTEAVKLTEVAVDADGAPVIRLSGTFAIALGADYPRVVSGGIEVFESSCLIEVTEVDFTSIEGGDGVVRPLGAEGTTWTLEAQREGTTSIRLRGVYDPAAGESRCGLEDEALPIALEVDFAVSVRTPADITLDLDEVCPIGGARLQSERFSGVGLLRPVDDGGMPFVPRNATPQRPVSVLVSAVTLADLALLDDARGLGSLRLPRVTELELRLLGGGPVHSIALHDPWEVTDVELSFVLPGYGGSPIALVDGETYGENGFGRTLGHVFPQVGAVAVNGEPTCDAPDVNWFALQSTTADTCVVHDPTPVHPGLAVYWGGATTVSAEVRSDGACELELVGRDLQGGQGLGAALAVTFVNSDALVSL